MSYKTKFSTNGMSELTPVELEEIKYSKVFSILNLANGKSLEKISLEDISATYYFNKTLNKINIKN